MTGRLMHELWKWDSSNSRGNRNMGQDVPRDEEDEGWRLKHQGMGMLFCFLHFRQEILEVFKCRWQEEARKCEDKREEIGGRRVPSKWGGGESPGWETSAFASSIHNQAIS